MNSTDFVALSKEPASLPLPTNRGMDDAISWAKGSAAIILENIAVMDMRIQRTMKKLIKADWPEGIIALGDVLEHSKLPQYVKNNRDWVSRCWFNNDRNNENFLVLATQKKAQRTLKMLEARADFRSRISNESLRLSIELSSKDTEKTPTIPPVLIQMVKERPFFFAAGAKSPGGDLAWVLAMQGKDNLLFELGAVEHLDNIEKHWLQEGLLWAVAAAPAETGRKFEDPIEMIAAYPEILLKQKSWINVGNTIFSLYIQHINDEVPNLIKRYAPLLSKAETRPLVGMMATWERKHQLHALTKNTDRVATKKPGQRL